MALQSVGLRELKSRLSEFIRMVKMGDTIIITEHGKAVGKIVPEVAGSRSLEEKLNELRVAGMIEWNGKKPASIEPVGSTIGSKTLSEMVIEDRR